MTVVRPRGPLWEIICDECGASWHGPSGEQCWTCERRHEMEFESRRTQLLFPEWLGWGERFERCNGIDRIVWAETRGFTGDYRGKWKRDLFNAIPKFVSAREAADALKRYEKWMTHIERFDNSLPNLT
jgi:hypothetical protein